ncbi:hypothetical protein G1H11_17800 [Phytoactinopolyspora alkaliphila]|uniref:ATP-grasp domain-containing protein n=1 Tax=Phytoactinopolyspora alkaliphila TaxID=1783498 RepID=A0A6N9YQ27_9ACTN|nr:hypothetical protein [Phytoactinopolyspora alkaliphila]NED97156.1 hypothetical protein [Phytoactinopolyspora alkaliphila]
MNTRLAVRCSRQKEITSRLLRARGVPAPENTYFHGDDLDRAWAWAEPVLPVVVKPHNGSQGDAVYVNITERAAFDRAFVAVAQRFGGVLIEVFCRGVEHRVTTVDGEIVAVTKRVPAHVVGDGHATVETLVDRKNELRKSSRNRIHKMLTLDDTSVAHLAESGLSPTSVPEAGQQVFLRGTSNISSGGDAMDATDELQPDEAEVVRLATRALPGVRLAGFDVLLPRDDGHDGVCILETNLAPMISMHHFPWHGKPREPAARILDAMFPLTV